MYPYKRIWEKWKNHAFLGGVKLTFLLGTQFTKKQTFDFFINGLQYNIKYILGRWTLSQTFWVCGEWTMVICSYKWKDSTSQSLQFGSSSMKSHILNEKPLSSLHSSIMVWTWQNIYFRWQQRKCWPQGLFSKVRGQMRKSMDLGSTEQERWPPLTYNGNDVGCWLWLKISKMSTQCSFLQGNIQGVFLTGTPLKVLSTKKII